MALSITQAMAPPLPPWSLHGPPQLLLWLGIMFAGLELVLPLFSCVGTNEPLASLYQ